MATLNDYTRTTWQTGDVIDATKMNNLEAQVDAITDNARDNGIAAVFSASSTYSVGDFCLYNGELYKCKTKIASPEFWTSSHWTRAYLTDAVNNVGSIVARPYSPPYKEGEHCTHNGNLYKAKQDISTAEEWTASHWTQTVVGDELTDLNGAVSDLTGNTIYAYTADESVGINDIPNQAQERGWESVVVICQEGDVFNVKGKGGNSTRLWMFADSNGTVITSANSGVIANDYITIIAPENAYYLCCNSQYTVIKGVLYKNTLLRNGIADAKSAIADAKSAIDNQIAVTRSLYTNTKTTYVPDFVQGRIDSHTDPAVIVSNDTTRVITKDIINFIAYDNIEITAAEGYRFSVWRYAGESESDYISDNSWQTSYKPASLGIRCLRIYVSKTDSSRITPDEAKKNITVTVYGHSIPNNFENISFQNAIRDWSDALTINGYVDAFNGQFNASYKMTTQFRCVSGDRIVGTSAVSNGLKLFVVYDRFGNVSHEIRGTGANNTINIDYTFTDDDYYFVIICNASQLARYSMKYISKYNFPILSTGEIAKSTITLDSFDLDFEIGGINAAHTPPWWTATPITRIRNMRERPFMLKKGDSIYLTDYTDAKMYVVWHNPIDDTWGNRGWIANGVFNVSIDGEYWVLLANITEVTITDISSLSSLLRVEKHGDYHGYVDDAIIPAQRTDWIIKSINHRGYGRLAPENTIPAYALSAKLGWKYVETDIRFTSDGVAVLLHDESINRTARNADGTEIGETINIADITYEQALTYDFGIWKGEPYKGTKIPTLAEFVQFCKNASLDMYLEIKVESGTRVAEAVSIVRRGGMLKHATWIAFSYTALQKVSVVDLDARLGLLGSSITSSIIDTLNTLKNDTNEVFLNCAVNGINSEGCDLIAESGFPLEVYTPNGVATIAALDPYITGVTSDYINAGLAMFNESIK